MFRGRLAAVLLEPRAIRDRVHLKDKDKVPLGKAVLRGRVSMAGIGSGRVWVVRVRAVLALEGVRNKEATTSKAVLISDILKAAMTQRSILIRGNSSTGNDGYLPDL
jgi:hypothetical protein